MVFMNDFTKQRNLAGKKVQELFSAFKWEKIKKFFLRKFN